MIYFCGENHKESLFLLEWPKSRKITTTNAGKDME
jgi:hypothetical protein